MVGESSSVHSAFRYSHSELLFAQHTESWSRPFMRVLFMFMMLISVNLPVLAESQAYSDSELLDRPLMERYILDELKALRQDQQDLERRLTVQFTERELSVADKSLNYANVTVTYFFYIIAGVVL